MAHPQNASIYLYILISALPLFSFLGLYGLANFNRYLRIHTGKHVWRTSWSIPAACGLGMWATHFALLCAFLPATARFDPLWIMLSQVTAILGIKVAFDLHARNRQTPYPRIWHLIASLTCAASILILHYTTLESLGTVGSELDIHATATAINIAVPIAILATASLVHSRVGWARNYLMPLSIIMALATTALIGSMALRLEPTVPNAGAGMAIATVAVWTFLALGTVIFCTINSYTTLRHQQRVAAISDLIIAPANDSDWLDNIAPDKVDYPHLSSAELDQNQNKASLFQLTASLEKANTAVERQNRFMANMSHEIRTPMNGILAVTDALSRTDMTDQQSEMLAFIRSASLNLKVLLNNILDLSHAESGQLKLSFHPFDLSTLIREMDLLHSSVAQSKGINFTVNIAPDAAGWALGSSSHLRQILNNLLNNAIKFTPKGSVELDITRENENIKFTVTDTGIGFDRKAHAVLYERFRQANSEIAQKFGGSGLGLAITNELVGLMKGSLEATSIPEVGSVFTVRIPLPASQPSETTCGHQHTNLLPPILRKPNGSEGLRVLLVDDIASNRRVVQWLLEPHNVALVEAQNGLEALTAFKADRYDLVLMDMQMPVMDGLEATRLIREYEGPNRHSRTPIIMLTANALTEHSQLSIAAGADGHLTKPFELAELLQMISALLPAYKQTA